MSHDKFDLPDPFVEEQFEWVLSRYDFDQQITVQLKRRRLKNSTMRAVPKYFWKSIFRIETIYVIEVSDFVRDDPDMKLRNLDKNILRGWFAHELGHIQDYTQYNLIEMAWYGLKYVMFPGFARKVEHEADRLAVRKGFFEEVRRTKTFLFREGFEGTDYGRKLNQMYMSIDDLEICHQAYQAELKLK